MKKLVWFCCYFLFVFSFSAQAAEENNQSNLYIIFDGSNSMWGELPDKSRKIAVAKKRGFNSQVQRMG